MPDFLMSSAIFTLPALVNTEKTQNSTSINNASINYTNNKHNAKTKVLATGT
jgi:hypothetical protein